jgi:hypothetical protein
MKDVSYKTYKKNKCEVCGSTHELTVHHVIGTEFHAYLEPTYNVVPKDLVTLCRVCHDEVEAEIQYCIKRHLPLDPMFEAKSLIYNDYQFIKPFMLNKQKTKGKPATAVIARVEAAIRLMFEKDFDWKDDLEFDIGKKWGNLKLDTDSFCKMVRNYYRSFKQRKQLWK